MGRSRICQSQRISQYRGRKMPELLEPALVSLLVLKLELVLGLELVSVKGLSARINLE